MLMVALALSITSCSKKSPSEPTPEVLPQAYFKTESIDNIVPVTINFINMSKNCTAYQWDFGDGVVSSEENPSHTYDTAGNYNVKLVASGDHGKDSTIQVLEIIDPPVNIIFEVEAAGIKVFEDGLSEVIAMHGNEYQEIENSISSGYIRWTLLYHDKGLLFRTQWAHGQQFKSSIAIDRIKMSSPYKGITDKGIGIGSSKEDVEAAYPAGHYYPGSTRYYLVTGGAIHTYNNKVDYIDVGCI